MNDENKRMKHEKAVSKVQRRQAAAKYANALASQLEVVYIPDGLQYMDESHFMHSLKQESKEGKINVQSVLDYIQEHLICIANMRLNQAEKELNDIEYG